MNFLLLSLTNMATKLYIRGKLQRYPDVCFHIVLVTLSFFQLHIVVAPGRLQQHLMGVQHFSEEIDFHMLKNTRFVFLSIQHVLFLFPSCSRDDGFSFCLQVEFNKAAQSLTEAVVPSTQKKTALTRLVKVSVILCFFPIFLIGRIIPSLFIYVKTNFS